MTLPVYATVVLDVDSTVSGIEGIDWLARRRGDEIARAVVSLTDSAMRGAIPLESVYGERLALIRPRREDIDALSQAYIQGMASGCERVVADLRHAGVRVALVSGGLRPALLPLAEHLGLDLGDLHAVDVRFDSSGAYAGFDEASPLTTSRGKRAIVERARLAKPILAVGDGATDVVMREVCDQFAAFTGFASRPAVVAAADVVLNSFDELAALVFGRLQN